MRRKFRQLRLSDRITIEKKLSTCTYKQIAEELGVSPSTISREVRRNKTGAGYCAETAQKIANANSRIRTHKAPRYNPQLLQFVTEKLGEDWSPEIIAGYLKKRQSHLPEVSHETIYLWIYEGIVQRKPKYRKKKVYTKRRRKGSKRPVNSDKTHISERPERVNKREEFGHWEGDLIIGRNMQGAILTLVERKTRYLLVALLKGKTADEFAKKIRDLFADYDNFVIKSITYDNGSEAARFKDIQEFLDNCDFYFATPGCPWERGTNENTNGVLRRYFPKSTNFKTVTQEQLDIIAKYINMRPRKVLDYRSPMELFTKELQCI